jgi:DNA-binding response OmpR family regulator
VRILLPLSEATAVAADRSDPVDVTEPEEGRALVTGGNGRSGPAVIVVVEDEPGVRNLVERVLERAGHRVLAFADGTSAADTLGDPGLRIDLLVTDLVMPGPNGIEVARRARRARPDLAVLLMSGYAADALRAEGVDEGSIELLAKPFSTAELLERVAARLPERPPAG